MQFLMCLHFRQMIWYLNYFFFQRMEEGGFCHEIHFMPKIKNHVVFDFVSNSIQNKTASSLAALFTNLHSSISIWGFENLIDWMSSPSSGKDGRKWNGHHLLFLAKKGASPKVPNNKKQCVLTDCKLHQGQGISGLHSLMKKRNLLLIFFFEAVALNGKWSVWL